MKESTNLGMKTFDQSLCELYHFVVHAMEAVSDVTDAQDDV